MRFNMLKQKLHIFLMCIVPSISCAQSDFANLKSGVARNDIPRSLKSAMWNAPDGPHVAESIVESETAGHYYWLFRTMSIGYFDANQAKNVGGWPLTRWPSEYIEEEIIVRYANSDIAYAERPLALSRTSIGCLVNSPLRYGDINASGDAELVLLMGNDLVVFSPSGQRVIFMANLAIYDWLIAAAVEDFYTDEAGNFRASETSPQHPSTIAISNARHGAPPQQLPGYRGHAKLYFGDFDGNDKHDILVWRKLYISRLRNDETPGFRFLKNTYLHYQLNNGEYQLQDTEPTTINTWLTAEQLAWQKGYPSESECPGQEGQLIPEMHDPFLNDPEVLQ